VIAGTATNGVDYSTIADSAVIPAYDSVVDVTIHGLPTPLAGAKTVLLRIKSIFNCGTSQYDDSAALILYDTLFAKILTPDTAICAGSDFVIRVKGSDSLRYNWTPAAALGNSQAMQPLANPVANTVYVMTATWPGTGCAPIVRNLQVKVNPLPQVVADGPSELCLHTALQLTATASPAYSGYSYSWSGPNGFTGNTQNPVIPDAVKASDGSYTVVVTVDSSQCTARASVTVHVNAPDAPDAASPQIFCEHKPAPPPAATGSNLLWYTTATGGTGSAAAPVVNTETVGAYQFYVSQTVNGCESERTPVEVDVKHCCDGVIFIPDVFTPNGDGKNDVFRLSMGYGYRLEQLRIFNRWGQLVFQEFSNEAWDGTYGGVPAELGNYYYQAEITCIDGAHIFRKGEVMVVR
jgi:gliding motility-associated-like protein